MLKYNLLPVLSEELKTAMRLLGANRVADLNMQHVSLFGKRLFWLKRRLLIVFLLDQCKGSGTANL